MSDPGFQIPADYDGKLKLLEMITAELLETREEYAEVSGRAAYLRARQQVLRTVISALQSALRAEGML